MKKITCYVFFVVIGLLIIDSCYRYICYNTFEKPLENSGVKEGQNKFFYVKKHSDIVVLGASRAEYHYQTKMIEDSLGVSSYNYGGAGESMIGQYLSLLQAYKNGPVKIVILDITPSQLSNKWVTERISCYYPFYWANDTVRNYVRLVEGNIIDFLMCSSLIQYNSQMTCVLSHLLHREQSPNNNNGSLTLKYTGREITVSKSDLEHEKISFNGGYSSIAIMCFHNIVSLCKKNNTKLIVCLSPSVALGKEERAFLKNITAEESVECWDYTDLFSDYRFYGDASHLNEKGSFLFTETIIEKLRKLI